jgi:hypothetical protein
MTSSMPYASATTGTRAREEATKWLRRLGCEQIGFMDDFENQELILAFVHRGRRVQLRASARGWASKWLKENPQGSRSRVSSDEYRRAALEQGQRAVNSILRDEVKGYVTRIESGVRSFEEVFWPHMLTNDGRPLHERVKELQLLPEPEEPKVVALPSPKKKVP